MEEGPQAAGIAPASTGQRAATAAAGVPRRAGRLALQAQVAGLGCGCSLFEPALAQAPSRGILLCAVCLLQLVCGSSSSSGGASNNPAHTPLQYNNIY